MGQIQWYESCLCCQNWIREDRVGSFWIALRILLVSEFKIETGGEWYIYIEFSIECRISKRLKAIFLRDWREAVTNRTTHNAQAFDMDSQLRKYSK